MWWNIHFLLTYLIYMIWHQINNIFIFIPSQGLVGFRQYKDGSKCSCLRTPFLGNEFYNLFSILFALYVNMWKGNDWLNDCLTDWPTDSLNEWKNEWMNERTNERMSERTNGWMDGWMDGVMWMNEWIVNEWPKTDSKWLHDWLLGYLSTASVKAYLLSKF